MQRAAILSSVASLLPPYFSALSHKRCDIRKKVTERKMRVSIFSTNVFEVFLIIRIIQRHIVINVESSSCKVPVILNRF